MGLPPLPDDFEVGDWLVEPSLCRVSCENRATHLRPKLMDLLVFLASNQGRVVTKDEILDRVWPGEFVVESVLGRSVADLRRLLEDDAASPRVIETISRRGYRLIAPVRPKAATGGPVAMPSIAVLPFADMAPSGDQQYFCDGLAEELTNALCGVPGLRVIARTSAFAFRGKEMDVREIGKQLGVASVLEGAVQRADGRLRITVQLIDALDGCHIWSRRFDRAVGDVFAIQDEIAPAVLAELRVKLLREDEARLVGRRTSDTEAHDAYLRGSYICARRSPAALAEAAGHFERAIERDPGYALAHAALAECCCASGFLDYVAPHEAFPKAIAAAREAVQLDASLAEGHTVLAACLALYSWQWTEAERGFRRALDLAPSYSLAHVWYSHVLAAMGRASEALEQAESARQLDPLSPNVRASVGLRLAEAHRFEPAIEHWRAMLVADADFVMAHLHLGRTYWVLERYDEAIAHLRKAAPGIPLALGFLGGVLGRCGRRGDAMEVLGELERLSAERHVGAVAFALVHQGLGDLDTAFEWYARAFDAHEGILALLIRDPVLDVWQSDSRFAALIKRLRLPGRPSRS